MYQKMLCKSNSDKVIAGVCGGIAAYFGWSSAVVRIIVVVSGVGLVAYAVAAIVMPEAPNRLM